MWLGQQEREHGDLSYSDEHDDFEDITERISTDEPMEDILRDLGIDPEELAKAVPVTEE